MIKLMDVEKFTGKPSRTPAYVVAIDDLYMFFSYNTLIGMAYDDVQCRVENTWGPTTGKHMSIFNIRGFEIVSKDDLEISTKQAITRCLSRRKNV